MKKILVVDDNPMNLKLAKEILKSSGFEVVEATDGIDSVVTMLKERPDMVLMDIQMPGMNGTEAMKKIKKMDELKRVPIVAVTASAMKGDRERFISEGFNDCVTKPFSISSLVQVVKEQLKEENGNG